MPYHHSQLRSRLQRGASLYFDGGSGIPVGAAAGPVEGGRPPTPTSDNCYPVLAGLIEEVFGDTDVLSSCHRSARIQGEVVGPDGELLEGIGLPAWQGTEDKSGYTRTWLRGFSIFACRTVPSPWTFMLPRLRMFVRRLVWPKRIYQGTQACNSGKGHWHRRDRRQRSCSPTSRRNFHA